MSHNVTKGNNALLSSSFCHCFDPSFSPTGCAVTHFLPTCTFCFPRCFIPEKHLLPLKEAAWIINEPPIERCAPEGKEKNRHTRGSQCFSEHLRVMQTLLSLGSLVWARKPSRWSAITLTTISLMCSGLLHLRSSPQPLFAAHMCPFALLSPRVQTLCVLQNTVLAPPGSLSGFPVGLDLSALSLSFLTSLPLTVSILFAGVWLILLCELVRK